MKLPFVLEIEHMPFCMGAMQTALNPNDLPNVYPFRAQINYELARIEQVDDDGLMDLLNRTYRAGGEMGTPSDSTDLGMPYVEDFLEFIHNRVSVGETLLEIGAGTGFLSRCLIDAGWNVTSVEPGLGYEQHWNRHRVTVINDFFPSHQVTSKYDAIVFYTVLEHIKDTATFLSAVKEHLKPDGKIFLGVPDCSVELDLGDPGILLHEHYQYFTPSALANTLLQSGFEPEVVNSKYGRSLFAEASISNVPSDKVIFDVSENDKVQNYLEVVVEVKKALQKTLNEWSKSGYVGIYCPSRLLNFLDVGSSYLFYDDALDIQGKYYPPFNTKVMSREQLLANPPKTILIASRTFGDGLREKLIEQGLTSKIYTLNEVIDEI